MLRSSNRLLVKVLGLQAAFCFVIVILIGHQNPGKGYSRCFCCSVVTDFNKT